MSKRCLVVVPEDENGQHLVRKEAGEQPQAECVKDGNLREAQGDEEPAP
jgi:hypothetical protein